MNLNQEPAQQARGQQRLHEPKGGTETRLYRDTLDDLETLSLDEFWRLWSRHPKHQSPRLIDESGHPKYESNGLAAKQAGAGSLPAGPAQPAVEPQGRGESSPSA